MSSAARHLEINAGLYLTSLEVQGEIVTEIEGHKRGN